MNFIKPQSIRLFNLILFFSTSLILSCSTTKRIENGTYLNRAYDRETTIIINDSVFFLNSRGGLYNNSYKGIIKENHKILSLKVTDTTKYIIEPLRGTNKIYFKSTDGWILNGGKITLENDSSFFFNDEGLIINKHNNDTINELCNKKIKLQYLGRKYNLTFHSCVCNSVIKIDLHTYIPNTLVYNFKVVNSRKFKSNKLIYRQKE